MKLIKPLEIMPEKLAVQKKHETRAIFQLREQGTFLQLKSAIHGSFFSLWAGEKKSVEYQICVCVYFGVRLFECEYVCVLFGV